MPRETQGHGGLQGMTVLPRGIRQDFGKSNLCLVFKDK